MTVRRADQTQPSVRSTLNQHAGVLDNLVADVETLRASIVTLVQQLDADAGVTDTDYEANASPGAAAALASNGDAGDTVSTG